MRTTVLVRRGYAMIIVVIFIVLFSALLGVVFRELAGALRIETLHTLEVQRDTGSIVALAQALTLLQTGVPPTSPYVCYTTIGASPNSQNFIVTFSSSDSTTPQQHWKVNVSPPITSGGSLPPQQMPASYFGASNPFDQVP